MSQPEKISFTNNTTFFMNVEPTSSLLFLDNLRTKTADSHVFLESLPVSKSIVDPTISLQSYGLYLNLMLDVTLALEKEIFPLIDGFVENLPERKKSHALAKDLDAIDVKRTSRDFSFGNNKIAPAFAMGIMYVLEGSTLGGRFILKNVAENLRLDETNGASYFSGYGNKTGSFWKNFLANLMAFETSHNAENEIIEGADFAFKKIAEHLQLAS